MSGINIGEIMKRYFSEDSGTDVFLTHGPDDITNLLRELIQAREIIGKVSAVLGMCRERANTRPKLRDEKNFSELGHKYVEAAGKVVMAVYQHITDELVEATNGTKQLLPEDSMTALVLLGEKAAKAALLRKKEQDNESYEMCGPLEYAAEKAEADLIRAAQEYFEQFPEVTR